MKGTAERLNGFAGDIAVTLTGVPAGVPVPAPVTVKAGETAFAFKLAFPPTTLAGESETEALRDRRARPEATGRPREGPRS